MSQFARVLLAEADSISTQLLSFTLEREGFEVVEARGGFETLRIARDRKVDIVLSELLLPDMDGRELCLALRADWMTQRLPIVLISSKGDMEDRIGGLMAGADDFLVKPFDVRDLVIRLRRLVHTYSTCSQVNPLTRLPTSQVIESYMKGECLRGGEQDWALLRVDVKHFSDYNSIYGFDAGDAVLVGVGDMLREVVQRHDEGRGFAGHDGRDDFIVVLAREHAEAACQDLIERFDRLAPGFYPREHSESRYQVLVDRRGNTRLVPRIGLSVGVVTNDLCDHLSYLEIRDVAEAVLTKAKSEEASSYYTNRRHLIGRTAVVESR